MPIIQPTGRRIDTINPTEEKYPVTYVNSKAYRAFCGEDTSYSSKFNESTLSILMSILSSSAEVDLKMTILKFLAVLVYSAKTLSKKVAVHFVLYLLILSS